MTEVLFGDLEVHLDKKAEAKLCKVLTSKKRPEPERHYQALKIILDVAQEQTAAVIGVPSVIVPEATPVPVKQKEPETNRRSRSNRVRAVPVFAMIR